MAAAAAFAAALLAVAGRWDRDALAEARTGAATGTGVLVSATPLGDSEVVICLVDASRDRMALYLADARRSRLKLLAVRDLSADWSLADYNNDPPLPKDIRARTERGGEGALRGPSPETPPPGRAAEAATPPPAP